MAVVLFFTMSFIVMSVGIAYLYFTFRHWNKEAKNKKKKEVV